MRGYARASDPTGHQNQSMWRRKIMTEQQTEGQEKGSQAVQEALDRRDNGGPTGRAR